VSENKALLEKALKVWGLPVEDNYEKKEFSTLWTEILDSATKSLVEPLDEAGDVLISSIREVREWQNRELSRLLRSSAPIKKIRNEWREKVDKVNSIDDELERAKEMNNLYSEALDKNIIKY